MNYIVFDLEWNQGSPGGGEEVKEIPFEIIDVGAVKLNCERQKTDEFNQLICPTVYRRLHHVTSKIIQLQMSDLMKGNSFIQVITEFLEWCGDDYIFCTWGSMDLVELQRNIRYYGLPPIWDRPVRYLDVQKLFSIAYEDRKIRRSLEFAIDYLQIAKDVPFHRAFSDAYYAAKILQRIHLSVLENYSFDTFMLPLSRSEEIHVNFENYHKYISVEFADKAEALNDKEVLSTRCFLCEKTSGVKRNLRRKIKWFTINGKHYFSVSHCSEHGFVKAKIRVKKAENEGVYIVKTTKPISESEFMDLQNKKIQTSHHKKMPKMKSNKNKKK
ncbi:MAG: exonuclease domain-containing protein [Lachnospiraceae bacterium]|jgi:inhibitor of KinA sporulation pathway (predicted exonuclease)|nr:exonuclease domain-containing protein [Lachnospiraceae bacterium]